MLGWGRLRMVWGETDLGWVEVIFIRVWIQDMNKYLETQIEHRLRLGWGRLRLGWDTLRWDWVYPD